LTKPDRFALLWMLAISCILAPAAWPRLLHRVAADASAQTSETVRPAHWRAASEKELAKIIPERAPVISERIETELRTASAIVDERGHSISAAVLITAGYSANGKYSIFLATGVPLRIGGHDFAAGQYLLGWTRGQDELEVTFSDAMNGNALATVPAKKNSTNHRVEPVRIWPPQDRSEIQLGRFTIPYTIR
jgi:hypothetical protein